MRTDSTRHQQTRRWLALWWVLVLAVACPTAASTTPVRVVEHLTPRFDTATYRPTFPTEAATIDLSGRESRALAIALPPLVQSATMAASAASPVPLPLVVMLHGVCGGPVGVCDALGAAGRNQTWLVCPSGNVGCGGAFDWRGDGEAKARHVDEAAKALRAQHPGLVAPPGNDILVGFSRGAFVARDVAYARPGRYSGLVLIGAALQPDPARLLASGVRRVVLASGDFDDARRTMQTAAAILERGGVQARFVSTGRIYHQLPNDLAEILAPHIAWLRAANEI